MRSKLREDYSKQSGFALLTTSLPPLAYLDILIRPTSLYRARIRTVTASVRPESFTFAIHLAGLNTRQSLSIFNMAAQAALIADTIAGMKRAIGKHEHCKSAAPPNLTFLNGSLLLRYAASVSDEPYLQTSNRGNKLKRKSCSLEDGQLGRMHGPKIYKTVSYSCQS